MEKKVVTYNIMLSRVFPKTHPRAGEETGFRQKLMATVNNLPCFHPKRHTIRENYPLWKERIEKVQRGEAVIKIRQWIGKPYRSKTKEIMQLTADDGVGIQKLNFGWRGDMQVPVIEGWYMDAVLGSVAGSKKKLAENDGLSLEDWQSWFKGHEKDTVYDKPLAIIHFTSFRY